MFPKRTARLMGLTSAVAGAAIGYSCVALFARQGFHAIVLPAALPGFLAGITPKERSIWWAALYGAIGMLSALFTEWRFRPFITDGSLAYFIRHIRGVCQIDRPWLNFDVRQNRSHVFLP